MRPITFLRKHRLAFMVMVGIFLISLLSFALKDPRFAAVLVGLVILIMIYFYPSPNDDDPKHHHHHAEHDHHHHEKHKKHHD